MMAGGDGPGLEQQAFPLAHPACAQAAGAGWRGWQGGLVMMKTPDGT